MKCLVEIGIMATEQNFAIKPIVIREFQSELSFKDFQHQLIQMTFFKKKTLNEKMKSFSTVIGNFSGAEKLCWNL